MEYYDLIIVGAGPAGSTLAHALEDSGRRALLIDKQSFPRDKTCAGWVTPAVMASLDIDLDDYARGRTLQPIRRFRIGMMGQPAVENDHRDIVSYGIRRCEFDHFLLSRVPGPDPAGHGGQKPPTPRRQLGRQRPVGGPAAGRRRWPLLPGRPPAGGRPRSP